jgi:hypothetical protein
MKSGVECPHPLDGFSSHAMLAIVVLLYGTMFSVQALSAQKSDPPT